MDFEVLTSSCGFTAAIDVIPDPAGRRASSIVGRLVQQALISTMRQLPRSDGSGMTDPFGVSDQIPLDHPRPLDRTGSSTRTTSPRSGIRPT
jgi:hypothetical protein